MIKPPIQYIVILLLLNVVSLAASFPLSPPVRPVSFPLERPTREGSVSAWGWNRDGQTNVPLNLGKVVGVAAGVYHSVALKADGSLVAWGSSDLERNAVIARATNIVEIAAGDYHTMALNSAGSVLVWGFNINNQADVPEGLSDVVAISAGSFHSVALRIDGSVVAWGTHADGRSNVPPGLNRVVRISAGDTHTLALKEDGTVVAWGSNVHGESAVPLGLSNVVSIAAGIYHSLALKNDGTVVAWGSRDFGQTEVPPGLSNVVAITAGFHHSVALKDDGTVVGWGSNANGETQVPINVSQGFAVASKFSHTLALLAEDFVAGRGWRDDFSDDSISTNFWTVRLPFGASSVSERDGMASLRSRGMLQSRLGVSTEFSLEGRFKLNQPLDYLRIALRSSLAESDPVWHDPDGVLVAIEASGQVFIAEYGREPISLTNIAIGTGRFIDFRLIDDGTTIQLFLDGSTTPLLTASTAFRMGDRIALYNREFDGLNAELDYLEIAEISCLPHAAKAYPEVVNGVVVGAILTDGGCGYTEPPTIMFQGGGGVGAAAVATVQNGRVTAITMTNMGCCYSTSPVLKIASPRREPSLVIAVSRVKVVQSMTLGRRYLMETSSDLGIWVPIGEPFLANSEEMVSELNVDSFNQYFRIREVP